MSQLFKYLPKKSCKPKYTSSHLINAVQTRSHSQPLPSDLVTPGLNEFPNFLKSVESKWKTKLTRRFERERYVSSKEEARNEKLPRYILSMFPYPSGRLHLGHVRIYTSGDVLARYSRLMSRNRECSDEFTHVINPMGFDSFGLPAENAAKERGLDPAKWTNSNIRVMKQQLDDLSLQFDWREATSNPSFYKWTQELFLKLMDSDLVYKSFAQVNWDPIDRTVLADEQVDEDGRSWRSGALVEKRNLQQWFVKVNAFIDDIYKAEDVNSESWGDILTIQRNWTGEPCGWLFYIPISTSTSSSFEVLPVFTRTPELFIKKEAKLLISNDHWLETVYKISQKGFIQNPFTMENLKVELTENSDDLPANSKATLTSPDLSIEEDECQSGNLDRGQIILKAKLLGLGGYYTSDKYRDWLISRQRYWGTPIPVIRCDSCGYQGVARDCLPVTLPHIESFKLMLSDKSTNGNRITSPIEESAPQDWLQTQCPSCRSEARRECETFDTLFDSSWYFLRYATASLTDQPYDPSRVQPVWCYIGGKEHASMHLFYARFITHFLHSRGLLQFREPFERLLVQGVVKGKTYRLNGRCLSSVELDSLQDKSQLSIDYEKMSKSKGNGVDPENLLDTYGIDATRLCLMSYANPRSERLWRSTEEEYHDVLLFLRRITLTVEEYSKIMSVNQKSKLKELSQDELESKRARLDDIRNSCSVGAIYNIQETYQFRQFISELHTLLNSLRAEIQNSSVYTREFAQNLATLIVMLNPLTPHLSEELWSHFSRCAINPLRKISDSRFNLELQASDQAWPKPDETYPLTVKVFAQNADQCIDKISMSRDEFRSSNHADIAKLVESRFASNNDSCKVLNVQKFDDLVAIVIARIDSVQKNKKRKKKKETSKE